MKRIVGVFALVVLVAACSASSKKSTSPTSTHGPTTSSTTMTTVPLTCRGCGLPRLSAIAHSLCTTAFGNEVVDTAPTTVGAVRRTGIGLLGGMFEAAFPGVHDGEVAAWCMLSTSAHCYDESAVAVNGARQHIATVGYGWPKGHPHAGPPIWTN